MASLAPSSPIPSTNGHTRRDSHGFTQPFTTISPSLLQATVHRPTHAKTSEQGHNAPGRYQESNLDQIPFPALPEVPHGLDFGDFSTDVHASGLMSTTFANGGYNGGLDDFMTPDYSTDNLISEHTTPQEAIWERDFHQSYISNSSAQPHILDTSSQRSGQEDGEKELQSIFAAPQSELPKYISGAQLLSPQLSSPSPVAVDHQAVPQPAMERSSKKRGAESLQISTDSSSLRPHHHSGQSSAQPPVSPVIMVSSHPQGDSPAHATPPRHRSLSRSRHSPLHDAFTSQSHLLHPGHLEAAEYGDDVDRSGLEPGQRSADEVATVNEMAHQRSVDGRNVEVVDWLQKSATGSDHGEERVMRQLRADRPRAHSTGVKVDAMGLPVYSDSGIPGPGVLIDEISDEEGSEDESVTVLASDSESDVPESPPVNGENLHDDTNQGSYFPSYEDDEIPPEMEDPHPRQFYRREPWQDAPRGPIHDQQWQPFSSNAAAMRYNEEAAKWETASRAATWGTRRRLSDSEVQSIVDGSRVRHLSLVKRGRARGSTLIKRAKNKANDLIPRRSNSNIKKAAETPSSPEVVQLVESPQPRESFSSGNPLQRLSSFGKTKAPPLETITTIDTSLGVGFSGEAISADSLKPKSEGLRSPLQLLRKARSKSDVGKTSGKSSPGLGELMNRHGGPPVMNLASPGLGASPHLPQRESYGGAVVDEDEDDDMDEVGVKMEFDVLPQNIIPNLEGFKIHARQLNPRLEPYLIDRIGQEQVRRYKKLIDHRIRHAKNVRSGQCSSKDFCYQLGGDGKLLTPRPSTRDPNMLGAQFAVNDQAEGDVDDPEFEEGVVTPALFPRGIPLPPVKRLPAEFECSLCFKVKKFQKPSDWTKHVQEDIQPFSCTFPNCAEPKSFKRKADWVRHENERHRRLEYWKCSVPECSHVCYRKDNFVQHLVREHKKTEPKVKKSNGRGKDIASQHEDHEVWRLVEKCRHDTTMKPRDEPCRFCGNICTSWKKLSAHVGKHMEQIALPIVDLVEMKHVTADTMISPIDGTTKLSKAFSGRAAMKFGPGIPLEQFATMQHLSASPTLASQHDSSLSPYARSVQSHHDSSVSHSPATRQVQMQADSFGYGVQNYQNPTMMNTNSTMYGPSTHNDLYQPGSTYANGTYVMSGQYETMNTHVDHSYSSNHSIQTPMSAHDVSGMSATNYNSHGSQSTAGLDMSSYQHYGHTAEPETYHDGSQAGQASQQHYGMSNHFGHHQNMYPFP